MKLKNLTRRIPRPVRAVFSAVCVVVLAIAYYIALGCPTLTFRQEFRRAEKVNLVGPSKIVDTMKDEYSEFDKMIVGETEYGICFFGRFYNQYPYDDPFAEKQYLFHYVRKTGDMTLAAAPNIFGAHWDIRNTIQLLPVYLFTENADAVRAEVKITVTEAPIEGADDYSPAEYHFQAETTRSDSSYFKFWLTADDEGSLTALCALSDSTGNSTYGAYNPYGNKIVATVRLYNADGQLIAERDLTISADDNT